MSRHINSSKDVREFYSNNADANLRKALTENHNLYDLIQGYSTYILSGDDKSMRYQTFKVIAGYTLDVCAQSDETIETWLKDGAKNHHSAFFDMLKYEKQLRDAEKGIINPEEEKKLKDKLRAYKSSSTSITKSEKYGGRIGTAVLYPMLAIAHSYDPFGTENENFKKFVINFYDTELNIDVTAEFKEFEDKVRKTNKKSKQKTTYSYVSKEEEKKEAKKPDEEKKEAKGATEAKPVMSNKQIIKILVDESIIKQIAEDVKFVNNQQFIKYAKEKFLSEENYSNLNLEKFIIHVCDQIGSKTGESDVFPFAGANTPEEVRNVFISLPSVLQGSLMKNLYAIRAVRNIFNDINDFNNLSSEQKNTLNQLGSLNDTIKEKIDEQKKETKLAKQNSKSMRRLHTLTKDRTLVND